MNFAVALQSFQAAQLAEAYAPKREPTQAQQDWDARKQEMLKKFHGRKHKSGHSTRGVEGYFGGRRGERLTHEKERDKAQNKPARSTERQQIAAPKSEVERGVRKGLSKGAPSGFLGKTAVTKSKERMKATAQPKQPEAKPNRWAALSAQLQRRPKDSPSQDEIAKRTKDADEAAKATAAHQAALQRMKTAGRRPPKKLSASADLVRGPLCFEGFGAIAKRFKKAAVGAAVAGACVLGQGCAAQPAARPDTGANWAFRKPTSTTPEIERRAAARTAEIDKNVPAALRARR